MEVNKNKLIKSGLSPTLFLTLQSITYDDKEILQYIKNLKIFEQVIIKLEKEGYVKITGSDKAKDFALRKKSLSLFTQNLNISEWYEEWRDLFPKGINSSGYRYRGNRQQVFTNLTKFVRKYPKYSKEQILKATKNYITRCIKVGSYMMLAHYFINKQDVGSTLLTELENLEDNGNEELRRVTII